MEVTETKVSPLGKMSVTLTPVALFGPLFTIPIVYVKVSPTLAVVLSTVLVTARFTVEPPQPDVQTAEAMVKTSVCVDGPQLFVAVSGILKVPAVVGVPLIVSVVVAKVSPSGKDEVATENVVAVVDDAVNV